MSRSGTELAFFTPHSEDLHGLRLDSDLAPFKLLLAAALRTLDFRVIFLVLEADGPCADKVDVFLPFVGEVGVLRPDEDLGKDGVAAPSFFV